jgi:hypothetical protein
MLGRFECSTSFRQFCFGVGNHGKHTDRKPEQKEPAIMRRLGPILVNYAIAVSPTFYHLLEILYDGFNGAGQLEQQKKKLGLDM